MQNVSQAVRPQSGDKVRVIVHTSNKPESDMYGRAGWVIATSPRINSMIVDIPSGFAYRRITIAMDHATVLLD